MKVLSNTNTKNTNTKMPKLRVTTTNNWLGKLACWFSYYLYFTGVTVNVQRHFEHRELRDLVCAFLWWWFGMWFTLISVNWVRQIVRPNGSGPHPISWRPDWNQKVDLAWGVRERPDCLGPWHQLSSCLQTPTETAAAPWLPWIPSMPIHPEDFKICQIP